MTDKEIEVIVKPIFTKMFNADFSAREYGIECYKKGMEYQGIKELIIENDNLAKRVKRLEEQIEIMKSCVNCRYCIDEKCPWQPKGCGMKHWELRSNYV